MNLENYYWYFNEGLSKNLCNDIIQYALSKQKEEGIGIRLENDILITPLGPKNLMEFIPIEIEEIEALMRQ